MTVTTTQTVISYSGNGATTAFPYAFLIPAQADVSVYKTNLTTGVVTALVVNTDYTISGLADPAGGSVTYPVSGSALAAGNKITIERIIAYTQSATIPNQGSFFPATLEGVLDRVVMMMQQLDAAADRTLRAPMVDDALDDMPNATLRALRTLGFDADGQPTVGDVTETVIAAAMLAVVQAATLAAARTALDGGAQTFVPVTYLTGHSASVDFPSAPANEVSLGASTIAVAGALTTDFVIAMGETMVAGYFFVGSVVSAGQVQVGFVNATGGAIDPAAMAVNVVVIHKAQFGL